jgi:hypothetical protein
MGRIRHVFTTAIVLGILVGTASLAALAPFDFTGNWSGTATSRGRSAEMTATFTSTGPTTFTGSLTLVSVATCDVSGTYGKRVKLHLSCNGATRTVRAHLDPATAQLRGHFTLGKHRAKFTLTKSSA